MRADNAGEFDPWIELYNAGTTAISLTGCYLSNDPANLQRITVDLPLSDRLLLSPKGGTGTTGAKDDENDVLLKSAMNDLEGFFRTLR